MAKSQMFKPPVQYIYKHGGVFPVRRGHHDEEAFKTADDDPRPGRDAADVRRGRALAHRQARRAGQAGIGRLALEIGRAGRAGRDPRLGAGCAAGSGCSSRR